MQVPEGEIFRLGVVSDTHGRPHPRAIDRVASARPHAILHAGDVGTDSVLHMLSCVAPTIAVRGNTDGRGTGLPDGLALTLETDGDPLLTIYLTHIGVYAAKLQQAVRARAEAVDAGLVVCGHSHVPLLTRDRGVAVFNPGSCGPRRFGLPITIGFVELGPDGVSFQHIDCETGLRWLPPE